MWYSVECIRYVFTLHASPAPYLLVGFVQLDADQAISRTTPPKEELASLFYSTDSKEITGSMDLVHYGLREVTGNINNEWSELSTSVYIGKYKGTYSVRLIMRNLYDHHHHHHHHHHYHRREMMAPGHK
jgi:hypothetical protein